MINNVPGVSSGFLPTGQLLTGNGSSVTKDGAAAEQAAAPSFISASNNVTEETPDQLSAQHSKLQAAVSKLNDHVQNLRHTLSFNVDEVTGHTIIRVYDSETNELIREIPSEEMLRMAATIETQHSEVFLTGKQA